MRAVMIGPPGSGKGTQCALIREQFGVHVISTGDVFRKRMETDSALRDVISSGGYVSDSTTNRIIEDYLKRDLDSGFILDGYPRTLKQLDFLVSFLEGHSLALDIVFSLEAPQQILLSRLNARSEYSGRTDDEKNVILRRLELHADASLPILNAFEKMGLLHRIDASKSVEEVFRSIKIAIESVHIN